jgi:hypothetical protein
MSRAALAETRKRADKAQLALYRAEEDDVDAQAQEAFNMASAHQKHVDEHLAEVERLEGRRYVRPLVPGPDGNHSPRRHEEMPSQPTPGNSASTQPDYANASCRPAKAPLVLYADWLFGAPADAGAFRILWVVGRAL